MNWRVHTSLVMTRKRITETLISPAFYIIMSAGFAVSYFLISGFTGSIGSDGLHFENNAFIRMITGFLNGLFGEDATNTLFSEGPFLCSLYFSFFPMMFYLSISSVFKFGHEKSTGALELVTCGPADPTSCFMGSFLSSLIFTAVHLILTTILFGVSALGTNLSLGSSFFPAVLMLLFLSLGVFAYASLASVVTSNSMGAAGAFLGLMILFLFIQINSLLAGNGTLKNFAGAITWILQWFSPFYYWNLGTATLSFPNLSLMLFSLICSLALAVLVIGGGHLIGKKQGVRA